MARCYDPRTNRFIRSMAGIVLARAYFDASII
ncbi:hypothetical protein CUJ84_Chr003606 [Rhizobium leguminosarum]|uniref:Uncharacterized protein n=1 Tax=Rhizobium leguminosarum TaxID=384 RepID=A0A2K9Z6T3_RHILE|nr:hypothetical protein CUJ84_Chr003606 [Rhizobium leguminosarum]